MIIVREQVECWRNNTYIADTRGWPSPSLSKTFDAETCGFCVRTALFPGIDTAWTERLPLIRIQTSGHHTKDSLLDCTEDFVGICCRADAGIRAGWLLHWEFGKIDEGTRALDIGSHLLARTLTLLSWRYCTMTHLIGSSLFRSYLHLDANSNLCLQLKSEMRRSRFTSVSPVGRLASVHHT